MDDAIAVLGWLQDLIDERTDVLLQMKKRKVTPGHDWPFYLVPIDEVAYFSATKGHPAQQKEFNALNRDVVARARAPGIIPVEATQRPSDLAPKTTEKYALFVRLYVAPGLGSKPFDRLQVRDVRTWLNQLRATCQCCAQGKEPPGLPSTGAAAPSAHAAGRFSLTAPSRTCATPSGQRWPMRSLRNCSPAMLPRS